MAFEDKAPSIQSLLANLAGQSVSELREGKTCPTCGQPVGEFRDELSRREYGISRMCQSCQDKVFGGPED